VILVEGRLVLSIPILPNSSIDRSRQLQISLQQQNMLRQYDMVKVELHPLGDLVLIINKGNPVKHPILRGDINRHPSLFDKT
jgi:hypothetical protein